MEVFGSWRELELVFKSAIFFDAVVLKQKVEFVFCWLHCSLRTLGTYDDLCLECPHTMLGIYMHR